MPKTIVPIKILGALARSWLLSDFVVGQFREYQGRESRFTDAEADDLQWYTELSSVLAPTHGPSKYLPNLILELGCKNGGLNPGAKVEVLPQKFPKEACRRLNTNRKLGISVMREIVREAPGLVKEHGMFQFIVYEAGHFGFGALYSNLLADEGLISEIRCTGGRGNEVIPWDGKFGTLGTNPITWALPTKKQLGFNVLGDCSTSPLSYGALARRKKMGLPINPEWVADLQGNTPKTPEEAVRLRYLGHHDYLLGLHIEAIAALIGGGLPKHRCLNHDGKLGGASSWLISVASPEYYSCREGDPIERTCEILSDIVLDNGNARLPGTSKAPTSTDFVALEDYEVAALELIAQQAKQSFDVKSLKQI